MAMRASRPLLGRVGVFESLTTAARSATKVKHLLLRRSPDLMCSNLMCEKVGEPCICRLARVLSLTPEVQGLDLADNQLRALPEEIWKLEKLEHLDLSGNRLEEVPKGVLRLPRLRKLILYGNRIDTLPEAGHPLRTYLGQLELCSLIPQIRRDKEVP